MNRQSSKQTDWQKVRRIRKDIVNDETFFRGYEHAAEKRREKSCCLSILWSAAFSISSSSSSSPSFSYFSSHSSSYSYSSSLCSFTFLTSRFICFSFLNLTKKDMKNHNGSHESGRNLCQIQFPSTLLLPTV